MKLCIKNMQRLLNLHDAGYNIVNGVWDAYTAACWRNLALRKNAPLAQPGYLWQLPEELRQDYLDVAEPCDSEDTDPTDSEPTDLETGDGAGEPTDLEPTEPGDDDNDGEDWPTDPVPVASGDDEDDEEEEEIES